MRILRTVESLREWRGMHEKVGFLPTMGALHDGHLSMVRRSVLENDATVVSVFVNPSQFAPGEDLDSYPRDLQSDVEKIAKCAADADPEITEARLAVFAPTVSAMYPSGIDLDASKQRGAFVEVLGCSHFLEGAVRPQFFRGVATVVTKLLNAVQPTVAYFGQKDAQQSVVVKRLVRDLLLPARIEVCPIVRESSGLAMSSRNAYLSADLRARAAVLYRSLCAAQEAFAAGTTDLAGLQHVVNSVLDTERPAVESVDYVSLNEPEFFQLTCTASRGCFLSIAVRMKGGVRLLDNVIL